MTTYNLVITNYVTKAQDDVPFHADNDLHAMQEMASVAVSYLEYMRIHHDHSLGGQVTQNWHLYREGSLKAIHIVDRDITPDWTF